MNLINANNAFLLLLFAWLLALDKHRKCLILRLLNLISFNIHDLQYFLQTKMFQLSLFINISLLNCKFLIEVINPFVYSKTTPLTL